MPRKEFPEVRCNTQCPAEDEEEALCNVDAEPAPETNMQRQRRLMARRSELGALRYTNEHSVALHGGSSLLEHRTVEATRASAVQQKLVEAGAVLSETRVAPGIKLAGGPDDHIIQSVLLGRPPAECWRNHARRVDECRPKIQQNRRHQQPLSLDVFTGLKETDASTVSQNPVFRGLARSGWKGLMRSSVSPATPVQES